MKQIWKLVDFILFSIFLVVFYRYGSCLSFNSSDMISFVSIISGALLSAISILYTSSVRQILLAERVKSYTSKWEKLVATYFHTLLLSIILSVILIINIMAIPKFITLSLFAMIILKTIIVGYELHELLLIRTRD
ncbi:hypothetical protein [Streptococcus sp.]|nr:hypothetical protein [Streptococcus sp.]MDY3824220.1 hypothetical protein [Streptococcus sp.]